MALMTVEEWRRKKEEEKKQRAIKSSGTSSESSSDGSSGESSGLMTPSEWKAKKKASSSAQGWAESADSLLKEVQEYYSSWRNDEEQYRRFQDRASTLLSTADGWRKQYAGNDDAIKSINSVVTSLSDLKKYTMNYRDYYSQWDSADAYNSWYNKESFIKAYLDDPSKATTTMDYENDWLEEAQARAESNRILGAEDFQTHSQYVSTRTDNIWDGLWSQYGMGYGDLTYEYINNQNGLRDEISRKSRVYRSDTGDSKSSFEENRYDYMKPEEVSIYNYYYAKYGREKAEEYLASIGGILEARENSRTLENASKFANAHPYISSALSVVSSLGSGSEYVEDVFEYAKDKIMGNPARLDTNEAALITNTIRGTVSEKVDWEIGNWDAFDFLYNTAMSGADSLASGLVFGNAGGAVLGLSAAAQGTNDALARGMSDGQAFWNGLFSGVFEGLFETVSLGNFNKLKEVAPETLKDIIKNLGKSMLVNASEETLTELANIGYDTLVNGEFANYTWEELKSGAWKDALAQVVEAGASGALMGFGMGTVGNTIGYVKQNAQYSSTGKTIKGADGGVDALLNLANEVAGVSSADMQTALTDQVEKVTKRATNRRIGKLYDTVQNANNQANAPANQADIAKSLERKGFSTETANDIAEALVASYNGQELTNAQRKLLKSARKNTAVQDAISNIMDNAKSTMGQRSQRIREFVNDIARSDVVKVLKKSTEKEFTPEGVYKASEKGKAYRIDTSEEIDIKGVASIRKGELLLDIGDGKTINAKDVEFGSEADALIYEAVARMGDNISAEYANKLIAKYDGGNAMVFARGVTQAYTYGFYGIDSSELFSKYSLADKLTDAQRNYAYGLGRQYRPTKDLADKASAHTTKAPAEKGVYYRDKDGNDTDISTYLKTSNIKLNDLQKTAIEAMRKMSEMMGVRFNIFESWTENGKSYYIDENGVKTEGNPNGFYDTRTGEVYIDLRAGNDYQGTMLFTVAHELTHFMRQWSPEHFTKIAEIAFQHGGMKGSVSELVALKQAKAKAKGKPISYDTAIEELVADGMETILKDGKVVEFMADVKKKDHAAWQKIKGWFKNLAKFLRKLIWAYRGQSAQTTEGAKVADFAENLLRQIQQIWAEGAVASGDNYRTAMDNVMEANAEAVSTDEIITDGAVVTDGEGTKFSIKSMKHDIAEGQMFEDLKTYCGWTQKQVNKLRQSLKDLVEYMTPFRDILDMNETYGREGRRFSPYKPNSDPLYKISMDFSTLCSKRLLTQYVIENLQLRENRPMSAEEQMAIRDMLNEYRKVEKGLQVACAMCYVEAARLKSPKQIQKWLDDPATQMKNYFADKNPEFAAFIKEKQEDFKESRGYARNATKSVMSAKDVRELNKIRPRLRSQYQLTAEEAKIVERATSLPNNTYLTAANLANLSETDPTIYSAYTAFVRTATRSKSLETDEPYYYGDSRRDNGNGIIVSDSFIEAVNRENGMRFSSWSDWRIQHLLDYITAVIDNSVRGAAMHGYTKFGEEVRVLGKTGMMFNMSGVAGTHTGLNEDGSLSFSPTESIDVNEAIQLREEFPETAGLQCIGVSDDHIIALLRSDIIDYIIPYHVSGLNAALRAMANIHGWADYTTTQHAAIDKSIKLENAVDKEHWHEEPVYSEFFVGYDTGMTGIEAMRASADRYKQMCKDRGLTPKFNQFAAEDNYWKLLIDRKMINQKTGNLIQQKAVTPTFDFGTIKEVVDRYVQNYDSGLEARALNHIVENWDSIPQRIRDLKKQGGTKAKKASKAVDTLANQTLAAQPTTKNSLREIIGPSGKSYGIGVYLDSTLLSNLSEDERVEMVKEYVKELGGSVFTAYDNNHNAVDVHLVEWGKKFKNKSGKKVRVNHDMTSYLNNEVKQEAIALVDELILASTYRGKEPASHPHDWVDNNGQNDWDVWTIYIQDKKSTVWEAKLRIANSTNGEKILYDIFPINMVEGAGTSATTTTNGMVSQPAPNVNNKNSTPHSERVTDKDTLDFLNSQETITTYKTMQLVDGKLYPPMAARTNGTYEDYSVLGSWEQATEHPELIKNGNKFKLDKGKGQGSIEAAYNPYMHSSNLVLNDQFSGAYTRDNLVTVECVVPVSELTSGYHARYAKDSVGWHSWHTGTVAGAIRKAKGIERQVFLSRWIKPVRIVPDAEVAVMYKDLLDGTDVAVPDNVVTPSLLNELKNAGVKIKESGRIKYSDRDSEGNSLTEEQSAFFAQSKARDKAGNLLMLYHGTPRAGFTTFDPSKGKMGGNWFTTSRADADSYAGNYKHKLFDPNETDEVRASVGGNYTIGSWMRFDTEADRADFLKQNPNAETVKTDAEYDELLKKADEAGDWEEYDRLEDEQYRNRKELKKLQRAYDRYEWEHSRDATIGELFETPDRFSVSDVLRAWDALDSNNAARDEEYTKEDLIDGLREEHNRLVEDGEDGLTDFPFKARLPVGETGEIVNRSNNRTYAVYANLTHPYEFSANARTLHGANLYPTIERAMKDSVYDGVIVRDVRVGAHEEVGDVVIIKDSTQVKLASNKAPTESSEIHYQNRADESVSNRSLLANAFEGVAQNDIEKQKILEYKGKISLINSEEQKLHQLNEQIKELSFAKGPKDTKKIRELQFEAKQTANRISTYDKQLLRLEASKPLQDVLTREKKMAYQRAEKKGKEALEAYREKATKTQRELLEKWQASRKKGIESRQKTAMRHKIKDVVSELNQYLLKGTKDRHVPIGLQKAVAEALNAVNMDTVGAEERIAKLNEELLKAKTPEAIREISRKIDNIREMGERMDERLKKLRAAYDEFINSDDPLIANSHDDGVSAHMMKLIFRVGDTPLRDMTLSQLEDVYDVYKIVLATIRNANKSFKDTKNREISTRANQVMAEIDDLGVKRGKRLAFMEWIEKFGWDNLKPVYAMEHIGSKGLIDAYNNVRSGEDTWALDVTEARDFYLGESKKYQYDSWDFEKRFKFESTSGLKFELTLDQIMSLYAYSKRDQAADHLKYGGIVFDPKTEVVEKTKSGIKVKYNVANATSYNISEDTLADIVSKLTEEQKGFVDEMQAYLSDVMGAKGNEVSLAMYDVKLFREKHYFPLKSAQQYMAKAKEQAQGDVKIKNSGFSKETKPHAKNPIVLSSFMDVWASHVNEMSMYHAFVLPMEDFYRIYNYTTPSNNENLPTEGVNPSIENAYGSGATGYIEQMLKDLNGGARTDSRTGFINKMMGLFKKGSVFASLSVVVQQPSAIARAAALVDTKYFIGPKVDHKKHKLLWDEVKQYAPVAIIKEMGYFDTNMGKSTQDFIMAKEHDGWLDLIKRMDVKGLGRNTKDFVIDSDYRDEVLSWAPAYADELAWCSIWEAVKRETKAKHPGMDTKSEAFLKKAGERFTEVITKTQVYDSVLARSANMRSKDTGMKMATAFMAEPTTSINMVADALLQGKRGNKKYARAAIGAVIASQLLNSILVSFVYAGRDDDEDKTYWEKYIGTFTGEFLDSLNPAGYIPFIKDIVSIVQGYEVERSDMAVVSDLWNAWQKLGSDNLSVYRKVEGFAGSIAQIFGLPVKNIMRDARGIYQTIASFMNGQQTTAAGIGYAVRSSAPKWMGGGDVSNQNQLYEAILSGDKAHIDRVKSRYKDQDAINTALSKALRENDPRIKEAAEARFSGEFEKYKSIFLEIKGEGNFDFDTIMRAVNAEVNELEKKANGDEETDSENLLDADGLFKVEHYYAAVVSNDQASANLIYDELIAEKVAEGYLRSEAKDSIASGFTTQVKKDYMDGEISRTRAVDLLTANTDNGESKVKEWDFELEYGFSWSARARGYRLGKISEGKLISAVMDIEGESREGAEEYIRFLDLEMANQDIDITASDASSYFEYAEPAGISIDVYLEYKNQARDITGEGKKDRQMDVIHSLPITDAQKDALYFAEGWAASTLDEAPWH